MIFRGKKKVQFDIVLSLFVTISYKSVFYIWYFFLPVVQQIENKDDSQDVESGLERDVDVLWNHGGWHVQKDSQV